MLYLRWRNHRSAAQIAINWHITYGYGRKGKIFFTCFKNHSFIILRSYCTSLYLRTAVLADFREAAMLVCIAKIKVSSDPLETKEIYFGISFGGLQLNFGLSCWYRRKMLLYHPGSLFASGFYRRLSFLYCIKWQLYANCLTALFLPFNMGTSILWDINIGPNLSRSLLLGNKSLDVHHNHNL